MPYFHKILNDYFEDSEIDAYEKKLLTGISKVNITPYMEHIFAEVKDFTQYRGCLLYTSSLDHHDGSYSRAGVSAQAYGAAYVTAQKYGVDVSGFSVDKVCPVSYTHLDVYKRQEDTCR